MPEIVKGILARKKFVYLCTNALLLEKKLDAIRAATRISAGTSISTATSEMHDKSVSQDGTYDRAVAAIRKAKERGFRLSDQLHPVRRRAARPRRKVLRQRDGHGRGRHHDVAGLRL